MGVCRSPQSNIENSSVIISAEIYEINNPNDPIVIMGDINVENLTDSNEKPSLGFSSIQHKNIRVPSNKNHTSQLDLH